jgi:dolichol kinase
MPIKQELYRKTFHLFLFLIPFFFIKLGKNEFLTIFIPIAIIIITLDYYRCKFDKLNYITSKFFKLIMRDKEINQKKLSGMSWVFGGASLNFLMFDKVFAVTGFCILIFADAMAAVVGKSIKSAPFYEKSRAGSLAFFITSLLVILISGLYFECRLPFYFFAIFIAMFITFTEAYPSFFIVDDNLLIPMTFGICMTLLDFMWHIL